MPASLFAVNYAAFGVVMILFLVFEPLGSGRHLAAACRTIFCCGRSSTGRLAGRADERGPCLRVEKLEVVYQRARSPRCRASRSRPRPDRSSRILGTNGAGKSTTLRAISGFLGIDDARVTDGSIAFKGTRIANRPPQRDRRGLVSCWCPSATRCFPTSRWRKIWPRRCAADRRAERRAARRWSISSSRASPNCAAASAGCFPAASGRCWRLAARCVPPGAAAGRRAFAWARPGRGRRPDGAAGPDPPRAWHHHRDRRAERRRRACDRRPRLCAGERPRACSTAMRTAARVTATFRNSISARPAGERARATATVKQYRRSRRWYG